MMMQYPPTCPSSLLTRLRREVEMAYEHDDCKHATREATIAALRAELATAQAQVADKAMEANRQAREDLGPGAL